MSHALLSGLIVLSSSKFESLERVSKTSFTLGRKLSGTEFLHNKKAEQKFFTLKARSMRGEKRRMKSESKAKAVKIGE